MKIESIHDQACALAFSREELRIIHQALNEVCNGVDFCDAEFSTRMGTERQTALKLMEELGHAYPK